MRKAKLGLWMSVQSAHDAVIRGWSRNPKGRSQDRSASVAALAGPTQFNGKTASAYHGMARLQPTWLHHLTKRAKFFFPEKEFAEMQTVWNNHT